MFIECPACKICVFIKVDEIYHLASPASPPHYMYNPVKTIKTNTVGTLNMLGLAKRTKARILIASTSEVDTMSSLLIYTNDCNFHRCTEIRMCIPSLSPTGAMLTL